VLLRFKSRGEDLDISHLPVKVRLSYYDLDRNKTVETTQKSFVSIAEGARADMLEDSSVAKDYTIAVLAQSIRDLAADCEAGRYREAESGLTTAIDKATRRYPSLEDQDIKRTLSIAQKYQVILRDQNGTRERERDEPISKGQEENVVPNGDFALGNTGFTSGITYANPGPNCLWHDFYTVAPTFNGPLLHSLIANQEYAAPKRPKGTEQVLFANGGRIGSEVVWSTVVRCAPNTKYRVSFQAISLTPGSEWAPAFEIR